MIHPLLVTSLIILKSLFKFLKKRNSSLCLLFQTVTKRLLFFFTRCSCSYERERERQREIPDLVLGVSPVALLLPFCCDYLSLHCFNSAIQPLCLYVRLSRLGFCFFVCGFFFFFLGLWL